MKESTQVNVLIHVQSVGNASRRKETFVYTRESVGNVLQIRRFFLHTRSITQESVLSRARSVESHTLLKVNLLDTRELTRVRERPFSCSECGKSFYSKENLL
ncbi:unnamed protein product [Staurois parvus]|uniref:C2H2-type domain-containing protein n=1 Tax=Staurois parvus TaxID=386267 RepID=A0ABN9BJG3_9NEOB|nr:unnamed protein product [Staurois parvus]